MIFKHRDTEKPSYLWKTGTGETIAAKLRLAFDGRGGVCVGRSEIKYSRTAFAGDDLFALSYLNQHLRTQGHKARAARSVNDLGHGDAVAAALREPIVYRRKIRRQGLKDIVASTLDTRKFGPVLFDLGVEFGNSVGSFLIDRADLFAATLDLFFDLLESGHILERLRLIGGDLFLQSICLTHRRLVFFLVLRVFQISIGTLEISFIFSDVLVEFGPFASQSVAAVLYFAYRKGVLFKLSFNFSTPRVSSIQRLFKSPDLRIRLL